jgi:hypothetical protein
MDDPWLDDIPDTTEPRALARILAYEGIDVDPDVVATWDEATRHACSVWAGAVHFGDETPPPLPAVLEFRGDAGADDPRPGPGRPGRADGGPFK